MIRLGFLSREERSALMVLARDDSVTHRLARRANALVLLDDGLSCEQIARVLLLDDEPKEVEKSSCGISADRQLSPRADVQVRRSSNYLFADRLQPSVRLASARPAI
jgi:hypothetical protein